jgi:hypothetical protein
MGCILAFFLAPLYFKILYYKSIVSHIVLAIFYNIDTNMFSLICVTFVLNQWVGRFDLSQFRIIANHTLFTVSLILIEFY